LRGYFLWAGYGSAAGMLTIPPGGSGPPNVFMPTGRNLESIAECYSTITGVMFYAKAILNDNSDSAYLTADQESLYEELQMCMLYLAKQTSSSARVLWLLVGKGYRSSGGDPDTESFYNDYYKNYALTGGNINDSGVVQQVAFTSGPQTGVSNDP
jgi:hypothetical protein